MHIDPIRNTKMSKSELGDKCVICDHQGILSRWLSTYRNTLVFMTSLSLEKRQNQPDLQKIMTTAIIEVQKEKLLT